MSHALDLSGLRQQYLVASKQEITFQTQDPDMFKIELSSPVYIKKTAHGEDLVCVTRRMKAYKPYLVTWEGKRMVVVTDGTNFALYEESTE